MFLIFISQRMRSAWRQPDLPKKEELSCDIKSCQSIFAWAVEESGAVHAKLMPIIVRD